MPHPSHPTNEQTSEWQNYQSALKSKRRTQGKFVLRFTTASGAAHLASCCHDYHRESDDER